MGRKDSNVAILDASRSRIRPGGMTTRPVPSPDGSEITQAKVGEPLQWWNCEPYNPDRLNAIIDPDPGALGDISVDGAALVTQLKAIRWRQHNNVSTTWDLSARNWDHVGTTTFPVRLLSLSAQFTTDGEGGWCPGVTINGYPQAFVSLPATARPLTQHCFTDRSNGDLLVMWPGIIDSSDQALLDVLNAIWSTSSSAARYKLAVGSTSGARDMFAGRVSYLRSTDRARVEGRLAAVGDDNILVYRSVGAGAVLGRDLLFRYQSVGGALNPARVLPPRAYYWEPETWLPALNRHKAVKQQRRDVPLG